MGFRQETVFAASVDRVFEILTDGAAFAAATGAPALIDAQPGGAFACFGEQITGRFIEIVPAERVVQAWRVAAWPAGVYSIASFTLAGDDTQTTLTLDHEAYPKEAEEHLQAGWPKMYWDPFKTHLQ